MRHGRLAITFALVSVLLGGKGMEARILEPSGSSFRLLRQMLTGRNRETGNGELVAFRTNFAPAKEFLTDKEIAKIQDAQAIDARVKIYLEAAELRLKSAEDRLDGKEPAEGDPLEFFTPEDMLDGYFRIIRSVMLNLDEAAEKGGPNRERLGKALKLLKSSTERSAEQLSVLKKIAEEKRKEELWNNVNNAIDINSGAHEGAEYGLKKHPAPPEKEKKKK